MLLACVACGASLGAAGLARATTCPGPLTVATLELESITIDGAPVESDGPGLTRLSRGDSDTLWVSDPADGRTLWLSEVPAE